MRATVFFLALLAGCNADSDGDGLTNKEEKELGLDKDNADSDGDGLSDFDELELGADPLVADTDGDGLTDGEERDAGSDPTLLDTDGDTYGDYDEVQEGHDPADAADRIYKGYWPYNPNKDDLPDPGFVGEPAMVGDVFGRQTAGKDQFGEKVDLYDFAKQGRYIVIDASATWCGPCQAMASWLSEGEGADPYGYEVDYKAVRKAIDRGDLYWVTYMTDNGSSEPATLADVKAWDDLFPNEKIPVITDPNGEILYALNYEPPYVFWPSFVVLDEDMNVVYRGGSPPVLGFLLGIL